MSTNRRGARVWRWFAVLAAFGLMAGACGGDDGGGTDTSTTIGGDQGREVEDEGEAQYGGTLVVGVSAESDGWTPQSNTFADAGTFVVASVVEALAIFDKDGNPVPYLAESWESNEELTEWTVHIRPGISFHDGEPLDAAAVKENLDQAVASPLIGVAMAPMIENIEIVDDMTVQINCKQPWSALPASMLALQPGMMVSPKMFEMESFGARTPIGTGPFVFEEWIQDDTFSAVRNESYWRKAENGDQLPYLDRIEFKVIVDGGSRASSLDSGDVDLMYTTRASDIAAYRDNQDVTLIEDSHSEETFVQLQSAKPPFDNIHARRAAAMAIDPLTVVAVLGEGITQPVDQPFAPDEPYYNPESGAVGYDPEEAMAEIELYKQDTGEDSLSFTMKGLPSVDDAELLQLLLQQWEEVGIDATLESVEQTSFIADLAFGNFEAAYFRNFAGTEPDGIYVFLHSSQANYPDNISINFTNTKSDEIDSLLEQARSTADAADRVPIWQQIVPAINAEVPYIWLFNTPYGLVARDDVQGLNPPRELGFGDFELKWWLGEVWLEQ